MEVVVEGWFHETLDGPRCEFACIQHNHFGFALPRHDVQELAGRLADLLNSGECHTDPDSVICVDWSEGVEGWVMIAFRPAHDCQGRFYDLSKNAAVALLGKLRRLLERESKA